MKFHTTLVHRAKGKKDCDKWLVYIDGFTTEYSKGIGLREGFRLPLGRRISLKDEEDFNNPRISRTVDPTENEVLEALAIDASCYLESKDIDDFADNFCQGNTISETIQNWEACQRAYKFFTNRGLDYTQYIDFNE